MIVLYETPIIIIIIYHSIVALHLVGALYANHTYIHKVISNCAVAILLRFTVNVIYLLISI